MNYGVVAQSWECKKCFEQERPSVNETVSYPSKKRRVVIYYKHVNIKAAAVSKVGVFDVDASETNEVEKDSARKDEDVKLVAEDNLLRRLVIRWLLRRAMSLAGDVAQAWLHSPSWTVINYLLSRGRVVLGTRQMPCSLLVSS